MNVRYAVVGCCLVAAAILLVISANSNGGKDECRNWSARSIMSLFTPCVAKVEVNDPLNIGSALAKQKETAKPSASLAGAAGSPEASTKQ